MGRAKSKFPKRNDIFYFFFSFPVATGLVPAGVGEYKSSQRHASLEPCSVPGLSLFYAHTRTPVPSINLAFPSPAWSWKQPNSPLRSAVSLRPTKSLLGAAQSRKFFYFFFMRCWLWLFLSPKIKPQERTSAATPNPASHPWPLQSLCRLMCL